MAGRKSRKSRTDSTSAKVDACRTRAGIVWPSEVVTPHPKEESQAKALRHFSRILESRSMEHWTSAQVVHVARLALLLTELDSISQLLYLNGWLMRKEGRNGKTVAVKSPLAEIQQQLNSQCVTLSQKLGLCGTDTDPRTVKNQAKLTPARMALQSVPGGKAPDWAGMLKDAEGK